MYIYKNGVVNAVITKMNGISGYVENMRQYYRFTNVLGLEGHDNRLIALVDSSSYFTILKIATDTLNIQS